MGLVAGGLVAGLGLMYAWMAPEKVVVLDLDSGHVFQYEWTDVGVDTMTRERQYWTSEEVLNLVKSVKAAAEAMKRQQISVPEVVPPGSSRAD